MQIRTKCTTNHICDSSAIRSMYCDLFSNLTCKAANNFNRYMFCFGFYNSAGVAPLFDADAEYNDMPQEVKNIFFWQSCLCGEISKSRKNFQKKGLSVYRQCFKITRFKRTDWLSKMHKNVPSNEACFLILMFTVTI